MKFSYKGFLPKNKNDEKKSKQEIMKDCVYDFNRYACDNTIENLHEFGKLLKNNFVYSNIIWENNHRNKANAKLENIDMLIIDIDDGLKIDEVIENCPFQIMTLTTTSHTEEHHKFRGFILLNESISLKNNDEYRELLSLIDKKYFGSYCDTACFESGRAYITTTNADYQINDKDNLLDCKQLLKEVKMNLLAKKLQNIDTQVSINTQSHTIEEVKRFPKVMELVSQFRKGNHYSPVYRIMGICKTAGLSDDEACRLILSYNIGNEYSNYNDLMVKVKKYR